MKCTYGLFLVSILTLTAGCVPAAEVGPVESRHSELSQPGAWQPTPELVEQSMSYDIPYVGAGDWVGTSGCGGDFLAGTKDLEDWVEAYWPQVSNIGGYSCRAIAGSDQMSVHATGRALDIHIPLHDGDADNDLGDPLANYLIEHAQELGIQLIIWDRWIWSMGRSDEAGRSRPYTGPHPHDDHLHIELTPEAAMQGYPWWETGMEGPSTEGCGLPIPSDGTVIDNEDDCFTAFGPAEFWRTEDDGYGGTLRWTNAWQNETKSNWARWNLNFETSGKYVVEYHSVSKWAVYDSATYSITAGGKETGVTLDQSAGDDGWNELGEFSFAAGGNQWIDLYDNAGIPVAADQHIVADAIRVTPVASMNGGGGGAAKDPNNDNVDPDDVDDESELGNDDVMTDEGCSTGQGVPFVWLLGFACLFIRRRPKKNRNCCS